MQGILNWNEEYEAKLERILQRAELTPKQIAIVEEGFLQLEIRKLRMEWDEVDARMQALSSLEGRADIHDRLQQTIDDCTRQIKELYTDDGIVRMMEECTHQVEFLEKAIFELEEKCERLRRRS